MRALTVNSTQKYKKRFLRKPCLFMRMFILAGIGGFGGTMAALSLNGGTGRAVLYQSVTNTENGSDKGSVDANAMSVKQVADATANSVVEIQTESVSTNPFFPQAVTSGAGSGVILSKDGYIVTNNHVIEGASKVTVKQKMVKAIMLTLLVQIKQQT